MWLRPNGHTTACEHSHAHAPTNSYGDFGAWRPDSHSTTGDTNPSAHADAYS